MCKYNVHAKYTSTCACISWRYTWVQRWKQCFLFVSLYSSRWRLWCHNTSFLLDQHVGLSISKVRPYKPNTFTDILYLNGCSLLSAPPELRFNLSRFVHQPWSISSSNQDIWPGQDNRWTDTSQRSVKEKKISLEIGFICHFGRKLPSCQYLYRMGIIIVGMYMYRVLVRTVQSSWFPTSHGADLTKFGYIQYLFLTESVFDIICLEPGGSNSYTSNTELMPYWL